MPISRVLRPALRGVLAAALLASTSLRAAGREAATPAPQSSRGETLASFTLPDLDGRPVRLEAFRGRPVVVFFLKGSWCPHCVDLLVQLEQVKTGDLAHLPVLVLTMEPSVQIRQLIARIEKSRKVRLTHLFLSDSTFRFGARYRLSAQTPSGGWPPYLLLLDKQGREAWSWSEGHDLAKAVAPTLRETAETVRKW
jgi:peroxiredoxin